MVMQVLLPIGLSVNSVTNKCETISIWIQSFFHTETADLVMKLVYLLPCDDEITPPWKLIVIIFSMTNTAAHSCQQ